MHSDFEKFSMFSPAAILIIVVIIYIGDQEIHVFGAQVRCQVEVGNLEKVYSQRSVYSVLSLFSMLN